MKERNPLIKSKEIYPIGLGGGQFAGSDHSVEEIEKIVQAALDSGVNFFDTARDYGEERLGKVLKGLRGEYLISSKTLAKNKENVLDDIQKSLEKLEQEKIDFYFMHNPMSKEDYRHRKEQGVLDALREAKEEGLIESFGVSCDYVEPLELAVQDGVDIIMAHYNVGNTLAEGVIARASKRGIGVIAAKPFAGGVLVDPNTEIEEGRENEMTPDKALKFTLSNENISTALVGARYPWQIEECAQVGKSFRGSEINREEIKTQAFNFLGDNFCRDCRYCWPCEELGYDFDISEILRFLDRYEKYGYRRFPRLGFSKLPFKDRIENFDKCDPSCPFDIDIGERLRQAKKELDLEISKERWLEEFEKINFSKEKIHMLNRKLRHKSKEEAINYIHTHLIPENKIDEKSGIFLIEGIYSFGVEEVVECLE